MPPTFPPEIICSISAFADDSTFLSLCISNAFYLNLLCDKIKERKKQKLGMIGAIKTNDIDLVREFLSEDTYAKDEAIKLIRIAISTGSKDILSLLCSHFSEITFKDIYPFIKTRDRELSMSRFLKETWTFLS